MTKAYTAVTIHRIIAISLIAISVISIFAYVSLTVAVIFATAGRSKAVAQASSLTSSIGELEGTYLYLGNQVTSDKAGARGFVAPKKVSVVKPVTESVALSVTSN